MRRWVTYLAVLAVCCAWAAREAPLASADAAAWDPNQAAAEVLDARYQRVDDVAGAGNAIPADDTARQPSAVPPKKSTRDGSQRRDASATSTSFGSLVWIVLAIVVILAVVALVITPGGAIDVAATAAADEAAPSAPAPPVAAARARQAPLQQPRQTADQLAAEGKFAEAIHALLQQTLGELVVVAKHKISDAATSREIARHLVLAPAAGQALAALIGAVERTHFGDEVPAHGDYAQCRATFDIFANTYRGGPARKGQPGVGA
ncbi:MAG: hypothetical protein IPL79_11110 [Myxococcales bacterium]|nr:hypothetical protein [Myxococcales bacterium]